ncbi:hypothetical protein B0H14DRAFT_2598760 [Mycena olivaceomarginata]|nr:hypothetical protein B0H14DRAFT_2598760 [Mycena olivaceomarginata]
MHTIKFLRDDWHPAIAAARRGRSSAGLAFARDAPGPPIRSDQRYLLSELLEHANLVAIHRDVSDSEMEDGSGEESPDGDVSDNGPGEEPENSIFASDTDAESALTSLPSTRATWPAEMLDNPVTPRRPLITYARRDRERYFAERAAREQEYAAREQKRAAQEQLETLRQLGGEEAAARRPSSPRRSLHLRPFRLDSARELVRDEGHTIHALVNGRPHPLVDRAGYVMAVVTEGPTAEAAWFEGVVRKATRNIDRVHHRSPMQPNGIVNTISFGLGFSRQGYLEHPVTRYLLAPHWFEKHAVDPREIRAIKNNQSLQIISEYQNHLYQQFAPRGYAAVSTRMTELMERRIAFPAFEHSVFTTCDIIFNDTFSLRINYETVFDTMEAFTDETVHFLYD